MPQSWSDLAREASDRAHPPAACAQLYNIARIAGKLAGAQAALIWLADPISAAMSDQRRFGQIDWQIDGESSVFTAVMADPDGLVVLDAGMDARFAGYPSVRFFAGLPLLNGAGAAVGTLCVMDTAPRGPLSADLLGDLRTMAKAAVATIQQAEMAHWDAAPIPTGSESTAGSEPQRINRRFETLADALPQLVWSTPNDGLRLFQPTMVQIYRGPGKRQLWHRLAELRASRRCAGRGGSLGHRDQVGRTLYC